MTDLQAGIFTHLTSFTGITALIGTSPNRIFPYVAPANTTLPYLVVQRISQNTEHYISGAAVSAASSMSRSRWQITGWASTSVGANALMEVVRDRIDGAVQKTFGSVNVRGCFLEDYSDVSESPNIAIEATKYGARMDFMIWSVESVPSLAD